MSPQPIRLLDDLTDDEYREISQNSYNSEFPAWVIPKGDAGYRIIDNVFVEDFCEGRGLKCINGILYNEDGRSDDRLIKSDIQNAIKPWCDTGLSNRTASLLEAVKNENQSGRIRKVLGKRICVKSYECLHDTHAKGSGTLGELFK